MDEGTNAQKIPERVVVRSARTETDAGQISL